MDKRSWPWKKKSSGKATTAKYSNNTLFNSSGNQGDQVNTKTVDSVHISAESYAHLIELEDQVKVLSEKLSAAESEMITKDNMVKQHAKVADEAISGWENAEAESSALKQQLESVTLLKLTVEDRASQLDGALKECMKQMRNLKEESEQKLHDIIFAKTKQWEKVKLELEAKIGDLEQELQRSSAENAALSRFLQERSTLLMKISEEKSQAHAQIEVLKTDIQSREREIGSLKYEVHLVSKELEIRNEEKNMSARSEGVANKQHIEDAKKITKLEAECQRLRGLVRKKLPGPAALAQMKLEVENFGREYSETRLRRSNSRSPNPYQGSAPEIPLENNQQCYKENEFLTARLLAMEEETKILKEALLNSNCELQTSRTMGAKTASKLHSLEAHKLFPHQQKIPSKRNFHGSFDGSLTQNGSNRSVTSMSEDGIYEEGSCSESWGTTLISDLSQLKKEKVSDKNKGVKPNHLGLMDDFLVMERLACLSAENNRDTSASNGAMDKMKLEISDATSSVDVQMDVDKNQHFIEEHSFGKLTPNRNNLLLSKLQSRIASVFERQVLDTDMGKVLEDVKRIVQDMHIEEAPTLHDTCEQNNNLEDTGETSNGGISLKEVNSPCTDTKHAIDKELENAISQIHDFVVSVCREVMNIQGRSSDGNGLREKVEEFSRLVNRVLSDEINLDDYICALSRILSETKELSLNMLTGKGSEGEINSIDCIDKVTLLENKIAQHEPTKERSSGVCTLISPAPEIFQGPTNQGFEQKATLQRWSLDDFERLKQEKDNMMMDLARLNESFECTKLQLVEREQQIAELKSQLTSCQKSNSFADTQLKCMTESYKSLESHIQKLETELNLLLSKAEALDNELQEERRSHQDDLAKYKHLQEQKERNLKCSVCSIHSEPEDVKTKQEREIAEATEKLAECQETIFLLSRQLNTLRPPAVSLCSSPYGMLPTSDDCLQDEPSPSCSLSPPRSLLSTRHQDRAELETAASSITRRESTVSGYNSQLSKSDIDASPIPRPPISSKRQKQRSSSSSSLSSMLGGEKQARSFSKFFSKGKSGRQ